MTCGGEVECSWHALKSTSRLTQIDGPRCHGPIIQRMFGCTRQRVVGVIGTME